MIKFYTKTFLANSMLINPELGISENIKSYAKNSIIESKILTLMSFTIKKLLVISIK